MVVPDSGIVCIWCCLVTKWHYVIKFDASSTFLGQCDGQTVSIVLNLMISTKTEGGQIYLDFVTVL